jgi:AcrR family transcriptional regulator
VPRAPRTRRTADDARREILDAAERLLAASGPAALRLQEVAAEVGISHPAVLHHFGSREELIRAVVDRAVGALESDLLALLSPAAGPPDPRALLDRVFETLAAHGHARLLAWLVLSGHRPFASKAARANWAKIAEVTHAGRRALGGDPSLVDTQFTVILASLVLFAEAIAGPTVFEAAGLGTSAEPRFRAWFADLLFAHVTAPAPRARKAR